MAGHDRLVRLEQYGIMDEKATARILAKCDGDIFGDECVMWTGGRVSKQSKGRQHGRVWYSGNMVAPHRLLFHNYVEPLTADKPYVLHSCDTDGRCVCLKHLRAGLPKDNTDDRKAHGNTRGGRPPALTDNQVRGVRKRKREGATQRAIAKEYKVSTALVSMIVNRKIRAEVVED